MTARELRKILKGFSCVEVRQTGSHLVIRCGECQTVVPVHKGKDIKLGTLKGIEKDLECCLGKGWLK
jgi:predicted RNA binding protein YcfA (HicA-like mRNA interferase family)